MTISRIPALWTFVVLLSMAPVASAQTSAADSHVRDVYDHHNRAAMAARSAGDWAKVRRHAAAVDTLFNGNPGTLMSLARASARLGDTTEALKTVQTVVSMGVVRNLVGDEDLAALRGRAEWSGLLAGNASNANPVGSTRSVFHLPVLDFLAEDIAWDGARDRYLISSVRKGSVVSVSRDGKSSLFISAKDAGAWGMFALAVDTMRSRLWVTSVAMPYVEGFVAADSAKSAILRFDLATGALEKRYELAPTKRGNSPGDIALAPDGQLFVSDSRSGIVYVIDAAGDSLAVLVPEGTFMSPQQPAVSPDGKSIFVPDYIRGLAQVDRATGRVSWVPHPRNVALSGIDGLTALGPDRLIAIQNGVIPNRVISLSLVNGAVASATVLAQDTTVIREPTHGLVAGNEFVFIANSGWDGFDDSGALRKDHRLVPPVVRSVRITF